MVLPEVGAQGLVKLCWHCPHGIEGVIEGPLVWVPRASVRHTLRRVLEMRHRRRGYGYPRKRRQRRGDRYERGLRRSGPAPVGGSRGGSHPHDGGRPDPSALELGQGLLSVIAPQLCCVVLRCVALRCVVLCCAVLCCAVLCCAVLCCVVLCCVVLCCVVLCCVVLCCCVCVCVCVCVVLRNPLCTNCSNALSNFGLSALRLLPWAAPPFLILLVLAAGLPFADPPVPFLSREGGFPFAHPSLLILLSPHSSVIVLLRVAVGRCLLWKSRPRGSSRRSSPS